MSSYARGQMGCDLVMANIPHDSIGKQFVFSAKHGSHSYALMGTIMGMMWSDEGGLQLFVSMPEFWGRPLKCLSFGNDSIWSAVLEIDDKEKLDALARLPDDASEETDQKAQDIVETYVRSRFIPGEFTLL